MPAGWGSGKSELAPGRWLAQIRDVSRVEGEDFNDKSKKIEQFKWECDVQLQGGNNRWEPHTIYTKCSFADMAKIKDPQFVPKLNRLVRACGVKLPTCAEEAQAWNEQDMIGMRFGILVQPDPEDPNTVTTKYVTVPANQQVQSAADALAPAAAPERELVGVAAGASSAGSGEEKWDQP
jgi:hypothetical protein